MQSPKIVTALLESIKVSRGAIRQVSVIVLRATTDCGLRGVEELNCNLDRRKVYRALYLDGTAIRAGSSHCHLQTFDRV